MYKYKFSVIIPIYNVEDYLKDAIDSVINQSIGFSENIQLILVNDGSKDNFVIEDGNDNDYLRFANNTKDTDIEKLDSGTISSTYKIWQHDKGGKIFGVMYERKGDFVVIFYDFDPSKKLFSANYALTDLVNKDLKRAKRDEYKKVVLSESGSNIEFVKLEDKVEKAICDRWDGNTFKYSSIPYTKQ